MEKSLSLSEKLYLLAVHPQKGGIIYAASQKLDFALSGALFMEMILDKQIEIENKRIKVVNTKSNNPIQNYLLQKMRKAKRPRKVTTWISKFRFSVKRIRRQIKTSLVRKGTLKLEEKQFLFFQWKKPVLLNKQAVYKLQSEIENQILQGTTSEENIMLLSLIKPAGLLKRIFQDKDKRKLAEQKLKQLMEGNQVSEAVSAAVAAAQAVVVSVAASSVAVTAGASR
ncbi:GOLPH3/VPS74 family protein [Mariniphaga sp.]|uniref:GOLPH3/VPS74 family protein n=1 Tax=Mariniphaga sp. TaxID=1954475 RepID=UPI0035677595